MSWRKDMPPDPPRNSMLHMLCKCALHTECRTNSTLIGHLLVWADIQPAQYYSIILSPDIILLVINSLRMDGQTDRHIYKHTHILTMWFLKTKYALAFGWRAWLKNKIILYYSPLLCETEWCCWSLDNNEWVLVVTAVLIGNWTLCCTPSRILWQ